MITAATEGKRPDGRCHGAQNENVARKVFRESVTQPVKDYHGHPPEISSGKWPRIPPVPNITTSSHIKELELIDDLIESFNLSFHRISAELDLCFQEFDKNLAEIQSFDLERDKQHYIADTVFESTQMDANTSKSISNHVPHQVITEFKPYRDGYDPNLICIVLNQLATSRIMSLFEPHRDSYDSNNLNYGYTKNNHLPSSFSVEFVPHRDSYDQKQRKMDTFGWNCFATSPYLSYEYSYDGALVMNFQSKQFH